MRSPPLVEKFRRTKETMLQSLQTQPANNKLMSLERMFHEVRPSCTASATTVRSMSVRLQSAFLLSRKTKLVVLCTAEMRLPSGLELRQCCLMGPLSHVTCNLHI